MLLSMQPNDHHASVLIGTYDACVDGIPSERRTGVDVSSYILEQFTIDDARRLKLHAASKPVEAAVRTFILSCDRFTNEAQNALLKLLEDPPSTARFYIIIPRLSILIPTLRSRVQVLSTAPTVDTSNSDQVAQFLAADAASRLAQIGVLHKKKDTAALRALIEGVEEAVVLSTTKNSEQLRAVMTASRFRDIRGASHKMLLEHVALSLPAPFQR